MRMHVDDHHSDAWAVFDLDTGKQLDGVIWADDEAGEYEQYAMRADGSFIVLDRDDGVRYIPTTKKRGHIKFRPI